MASTAPKERYHGSITIYEHCAPKVGKDI